MKYNTVSELPHENESSTIALQVRRDDEYEEGLVVFPEMQCRGKNNQYPICGAHLDHGEKCDCQEEKGEKKSA